MAVCAVASAVQWIGLLLTQEGKVLYPLHDQAQNLHKGLEIMQLYLQDADVRKEEIEIGALISQVQELAYDAEDVIDTYILAVQASLKQIDVESVDQGWLSSFLFNAPSLHSFCKCIEGIQSSLKQVTEKFKSYGVRRIPNVNEWQKVERPRAAVVGTATVVDGRVEDLLALSYDDLPYCLKPCFMYLSVFPQDCEIPTGMLTRMWIAEGLITSHEGMSLEDVAMQCLKELSHHLLIQIARTNLKGEIKAIKLNDLLRDLCVKKAKEQSFLEIYAHMDCVQSSGGAQFIESRRSALHGSVSFPTQASHLRSITMLTRSSVSPSVGVSKELLDLHVVYNSFKLLRLLNLWGIRTANGTLPAEIGNLIQLRYLGIRVSNITELPESIGNMRNLLILDYRNVECDADDWCLPIKIPKALGKLVLMRHLFLPIEYPCIVEELQLSEMKNLRTLWGIKRGRGGNWLSREVADLSTTLKKLKIIVSTKTELEMTFNCLSNINGLCTFHCEMRKGISLQKVDHPLSEHQKLQKLVVIGEIQMKLDLILPCNLVMLELKDSRMSKEDPMEAIGTMQHLKLLRMSNSYLGTTFTCTRGSFPQLEELSVAKFKNLREWTVEEGSMLCLKKIEILRCVKLSSFPKGLLFVTTLQELKYRKMPQEFDKQARVRGWLDVEYRLPHNYEAIMEQSDFIMDTSSVNKIYEQLTVGIYMRENVQKYWVIKHGEGYYNCFMLYFEKLSSKCKDFRRIQMPESDGTLVTIAEVEIISKGFWFPEEFNATNLNSGITYEMAFIVMLPTSVCIKILSAAVRIDSKRLATHSHTLHDKPRDEWIRLLAGREKISESTKMINFALRGLVPGLLIKGVVIKPVF